MIASHGYIVFQPNYRGSDNLGNAYMTAIVHDTVAGPGTDIMAGLAALEKLPGRRRLARRRFGMVVRRRADVVADRSRSRLARGRFGGRREQTRSKSTISRSPTCKTVICSARRPTSATARIYPEQSPITYYKQITTPTLIWGTTQDSVVPIPLSYALFHALTENHVPVRFAVFPGRDARPGRSRQQTADLTRLWLDWLDEHLNVRAHPIGRLQAL